MCDWSILSKVISWSQYWWPRSLPQSVFGMTFLMPHRRWWQASLSCLTLHLGKKSGAICRRLCVMDVWKGLLVRHDRGRNQHRALGRGHVEEVVVRGKADQHDVWNKNSTQTETKGNEGEDEGTWILCMCDGAVFVLSSWSRCVRRCSHWPLLLLRSARRPRLGEERITELVWAEVTDRWPWISLHLTAPSHWLGWRWNQLWGREQRHSEDDGQVAMGGQGGDEELDGKSATMFRRSEAMLDNLGFSRNQVRKTWSNQTHYQVSQFGEVEVHQVWMTGPVLWKRLDGANPDADTQKWRRVSLGASLVNHPVGGGFELGGGWAECDRVKHVWHLGLMNMHEGVRKRSERTDPHEQLCRQWNVHWRGSVNADGSCSSVGEIEWHGDIYQCVQSEQPCRCPDAVPKLRRRKETLWEAQFCETQDGKDNR